MKKILVDFKRQDGETWAELKNYVWYQFIEINEGIAMDQEIIINRAEGKNVITCR